MKTSLRAQRGVTLVELMVAVVIGMVGDKRGWHRRKLRMVPSRRGVVQHQPLIVRRPIVAGAGRGSHPAHASQEENNEH